MSTPVYVSGLNVIGNGGDDRPNAVDITSELQAALATHKCARIEPGYYKIDPDVIDDGTDEVHIEGAGDIRTFIGINPPSGGNGVGILLRNSSSSVRGARFIDQTGTGNKLCTAVKLLGDTPTTSGRRMTVKKCRGWGLKAGVHLEGPVYYWDIDSCEFQAGISGILCTDLNGEGPNRGLLRNNLTEGHTRGYDIQGGNTIKAYGNNSASDQTGVYSDVKDLEWNSYTGEEESVALDIRNVIEFGPNSRNNNFTGVSRDTLDAVVWGGEGNLVQMDDGLTQRDLRRFIDTAPLHAGTGAIYRESRMAGDVPETRWGQRRHGGMFWGDGVAPRAHMFLGGDLVSGFHMQVNNELYSPRFRTKQQFPSIVNDVYTPQIDGTFGAEPIVPIIAANLTVANYIGKWSDGQSVMMHFQADGNGPYTINWGSKYQGCPIAIDAGQRGWVMLKKFSDTQIDCLWHNLNFV